MGPMVQHRFFDFRKPAGAKKYLEGCVNMTKTGAVDGCFIDGCLKIEAPLGKAVAQDFMAAKKKTLAQLQQSVPGPLICGSGGGLNPDMAASQVQAFSAKHAGWWCVKISSVPPLSAAASVIHSYATGAT